MLDFASDTIWAFEKQRYELFIHQHRHGLAWRADAAPIERRSGSRSGGIVAILPLFGVVTQRSNLYGTSTEQFSRNLRAAVSDSSISAIIVNVDSPGGTIAGVDELSTEIYKARSQKRIVAVANSLAASAAYWIASAAESLFVTPGGEVGSIGVFAAHTDMSKALEIEGVKVTLISSSPAKVEGNPTNPLAQRAETRYRAALMIFTTCSPPQLPAIVE
jgi:capsid assembly protease